MITKDRSLQSTLKEVSLNEDGNQGWRSFIKHKWTRAINHITLLTGVNAQRDYTVIHKIEEVVGKCNSCLMTQNNSDD